LASFRLLGNCFLWAFLKVIDVLFQLQITIITYNSNTDAQGRVTRLGELSPIGQFSLGCFFITDVANIFGQLFTMEIVMLLVLTKWIGPNFGRFFQKLIWSPCSE
jgi:hypothetical protein